ncbi:hypothetical protein ABW20_dc0103780 [Dactylellina cionopaga]|nr:hypothetical protein ABW20_dc0103780 [Dactylellina cionopaga]
MQLHKFLRDPYFQLCSCGNLSCHLYIESSVSGSQCDVSPPPGLANDNNDNELLQPWDLFDDQDPYLPIHHWCDHQKMLVAFAEHLLSIARELEYTGGTPRDRLRTINQCNSLPRSILFKLIGDSQDPSPDRTDFATISASPCYPASHVAEALFVNKHIFTKEEWYTICVFWFAEWTKYSPAEAWKMDVGTDEWEKEFRAGVLKEDTMVLDQPRFRRRFKAWAWWLEDGYKEMFPSKRRRGT